MSDAAQPWHKDGVHRSLFAVAAVTAILLPALEARALEPDVMARAEEVAARVNLYRRLSGIPPVTLDLALSEGCVAHANYLEQNRDQIAAGLDAHNEYPDRPGYTPEGATAGRNGDIAYNSIGTDAVDVWYQSYYHRNPILSRSVTKIGYGDRRASGIEISVLQFMTYSAGGEKVSPGNRSRGQAIAGGNEIPPPIPGFGPTKGNPIIAYFDGATVTWKSSKVTSGREELSHQVVAPNRPSNPTYEGNEICLITDAPLPVNSLIGVEIEYEQAGVKRLEVWSFSTSMSGRFDPGPAETPGPLPDAGIGGVIIDAESGGCGCSSAERPQASSIWALLALAVLRARARARARSS